MKGKSALMAGVAAVALVATAQSGLAAKQASDSTSAPVAATDTRYDELAARVDALEQELQAAELRAADDHNKVAAWKPMSGWWDSTSVNGRMYWNLSHIDSDANSTKDGLAFEIKRFYVGIDHKFNDIFAANVTTDFTYDTSVKATQVYLKKAYLEAKLDPAFVVRFGAADMAWVPYAEGLYGYRFVENTVADRTKFGTSADWGVHMMGKYSIFSYQLSAVNGRGYKDTSRAKSLDFEGRIGAEYKGFNLGVGGYIGHLGAQNGTKTYKNAERFNAIAAYVGNGLRLGVEYFAASNYGSSFITSKTAKSHATGVSPFGSYKVASEWEVFGRYDFVKADSRTPTVEEHYYNFGVTYSPAKIVDFSLVYKHDDLKNGAGKTDEIGIYSQLRW